VQGRGAHRGVSGRSGPEAVAGPPDGVDQAGAVSFELAAQGADMDLDDVGVVGGEPPDAAEQLGLGQHAVGLATELDEQVELRAGQLDGGAVAVDGAVGLIDHEVADVPHAGGQLAGAAQQGADAGEQFGHREGLDEVVVGAGGEAGEAVLGGVGGGEEDDGQLVVAAVAVGVAEQAGDGQAARALGEADVEGGEVGRKSAATCADAGAVGLGVDGVAVAGQGRGDGVTQRDVVLDQQYAWLAVPHVVRF
jgi:hypothetical protein